MQLACSTLGLTDYETALAWQRALVDLRQSGAVTDSLLLLEHPAVFTLGRGADETFLLNPGRVPVHRVGRGGEVTFHGPGQLVGYPILDLQPHGRDVHVYLRTLERVVIAALADWRIAARRRDGLTGVWVGEAKIASIGVGVRRWVTSHGFALNVATDLEYFSAVVPCGLAGVRMTSMQRLLGRAVDMDAVTAAVAHRFAETFGYREIVWSMSLPTPVCGGKPAEAIEPAPAVGV